MKRTEPNIYEILNLQELSCKYWLYRIKGIPLGSEDFDKNVQILVRNLSFSTKSPCIHISDNDGGYIAQPNGHKELPSSYSLVRTSVVMEKQSDLYDLDFHQLNEENVELATRFLQFSVQSPLFHNPRLWQPYSGGPFFNKTPDKNFGELSKSVDLYRGFSFRIVALPENKLGIVVDKSSKYVGRWPLSAMITPDDFQKIKGSRVVYEYGDDWYEITLEELSDLNVSELTIDDVSLYDMVHQKAKRRSKLLMSLPKDCSVLVYKTSSGERRHVASALCRRIFTTDHPQIKRFHSKTIVAPHIRRNEIKYILENYFGDIAFNGKRIRFSEKPYSCETDKLAVPSLLFGNNKILNPDDIHDFAEFPKLKTQFAFSRDAGFYTKKQLDRQYFIMPSTVYESYGEKFLSDIKREVNNMYPTLAQDAADTSKINVYEPEVIPYNDSVQKSVASLGTEIIKAVQEHEPKSGFGVVMIPRLSSRKHGKEDELANLAMRKLRELEVYASVIHTDTAEGSLHLVTGEDGAQTWELARDGRQRGKYKGYLQNVVLSKILLLNNVLPFVLATPLNADLVIGIDVKKHMAGFTFISKDAKTIMFRHSLSDQFERLSRQHVRTKITEFLEEYLRLRTETTPIQHILIHRDGILYPSEMKGIKQAISDLTRENLFNSFTASFIEIRKTSKIPLRLFGISNVQEAQRDWVDNPIIGTTLKLGTTAYMITTGQPYRHRGTCKPLQIVWHGGTMSFDNALQDTFSLANLTWTKIDDCSRVPISLKLTDIRLREVAGEFDEDALRFGEEGGDDGE